MGSVVVGLSGGVEFFFKANIAKFSGEERHGTVIFTLDTQVESHNISLTFYSYAHFC